MSIVTSEYLSRLNELYNEKGQNIGEITSKILRLRREFSLQWYLEGSSANSKILEETIGVLLKLASLDIPEISVVTYNALGGLLLVLTPFAPKSVRDAFSRSVVPLDNSRDTEASVPSLSIAISSCFVFLSHHIGPHQLEAFCGSTAGMNHFEFDNVRFLGQLPNLIRSMKNLGESVSRQMAWRLRNYVSSQHAPPSVVVECFQCLLDSYPRILQDILEDKRDSMKPILVKLGKYLLEDKNGQFEADLTDDYRKLLFTEIKSCFESELSATSVEYHIDCLLLLSNRKDELGEEVNKFIDELLQKDFPKHVKRQLMLLVRSVDNIDLSKLESSSDVLVALQALSHLVNKENSEKVIDMLLPLLETTGNEFYATVDLIRDHFDVIFKSGADKSKLARLLILLFNKERLSVTNKTSVCSFLKVADHFLCEDLRPGYLDLALEFALESVISEHVMVSSAGREAMVALVGARNIDEILSVLLKCDLWDLSIASRVILLLNDLWSVFHTSRDNHLIWTPMVSLVCELVCLMDSDSSQSEGFLFLSHFPSLLTNRDKLILEEACSLLIARYYWSFTHQHLFPSRSMADMTMDFFLSGIVTDVVRNPQLSHEVLLKPMLNGYKFLVSIQSHNLFDVSLSLICLFPEQTISALIRMDLNDGQIADVVCHFGRIFNGNEKWKVSAVVVDFLYEKLNDALKNEYQYLLQAAQTKGFDGPDVAASFFKALYCCNKKEAVKAMCCMLSQIQLKSKTEANSFLARIRTFPEVQELRKQYPFVALGTGDESGVIEWCTNTPFETWPVEEPEFRKLLTTFLRNNRPKILLVRQSLEALDDDHWTFLIDNIWAFDIPDFSIYFADHKYRLQRFLDMIPYVRQYLETACDTSGIPKLSSISPMMKQGRYITNSGLLKAFFRHSHVKISQSLLSEIVSKLTKSEDLAEAKAYARRMGIDVGEDAIDQNIRTEIARKFSLDPSFETVIHMRQLRMDKNESITQIQNWLDSYREDTSPGTGDLWNSCVMKEFTELLWSIYDQLDLTFSEGNLPRYLEELLLRYERLPKMQTPSDSLYIMRVADKLRDFNLLYNSQANVWSAVSPIVAGALMRFVEKHQDCIRNPVSFLRSLFRTNSSNFSDVNPSLIQYLLLKCGEERERIHELKEIFESKDLRFIPHAIKYMTTYDRIITCVPDAARSEGARVFCLKVFMTNPSIVNANELTEACLDDQDWLFSKFKEMVTKPEMLFLSVFIAIVKLLKRRQRFDKKICETFIAEIGYDVALKSRAVALRCLSQMTESCLRDAAFLCAAAETDDDTVLENLTAVSTF